VTFADGSDIDDWPRCHGAVSIRDGAVVGVRRVRTPADGVASHGSECVTSIACRGLPSFQPAGPDGTERST
jgi:hypothetical protein